MAVGASSRRRGSGSPAKARSSVPARVSRKGPGRASSPRTSKRNALSFAEQAAASTARGAILEAAVEALEHKGESTIRISEIARKAGVAVGLIYYHFTDREGLVSAAQVERMVRMPADDVNLLEAAVRLHEDPDHFAKMVVRIVCGAIGSDRASMRLDRVAILGASKGRPSFTASLGRAVSDQTDHLVSIIEDAKGRGIVDASVDSRAFATLVQAISIGMVVADLDARSVERGKILDVYLRSLVGFAGPAAKHLAAGMPPAVRKRTRGAASHRAH